MSTLRSNRALAGLRTCAILLCVSLSVRNAEAQDEFPYELNTGREIVLATTGVGLLGAALAVHSGQVPLTASEVDALDVNDINSFDRSATRRWSTGAADASDILVWSLLASPVALVVTPPGSRAPAVIGVMYGQALLTQMGFVHLMKGLTERTRPFVYNDDPDIPEDLKFEVSSRRSFVSGHAANAFTAAVFLSSVYSRLHPESSARKWVWLGSVTAAGAVGYFRYAAGKHFPTDIISGALVGAATGYLVPKIHESEGVQLVPSGRGVAVSVSF